MKTTLLLITIILPHIAIATDYIESKDLSLKKPQNEIIYDNLSQKFIDSLNINLLKDPQSKVSPIFQIEKYLLPSVRFWFKVYTEHSKNFILIHDKNNLSIVYDAINFEELIISKLNRYVKANLQKELKLERLRNIRHEIRTLSKKINYPKVNSTIAKALNRAKVEIPKNRKKRKSFYFSLLKNLRTQTGQKDMVLKAINSYLPYQRSVESYIKLFKLPKEIVSIPFVESSFNTIAKSKANAIGVWQFIWRTGRNFMPVSKNYDLRVNPLVSTVAALHLLKQNFKILKDWPLAITAYNSGPKHILKAYKKIKNSKHKLSDYFKKYSHPSIAFASKNYYSEFLAMTYALNYKDMLFYYNRPKVNPILKIYISKCKFIPTKLFKEYNDLSSYNRQFKKPNQTYSKGSIIVSTIPLDTNKFHLLTDKQSLNYYPKFYYKLVKNYNCSKR